MMRSGFVSIEISMISYAQSKAYQYCSFDCWVGSHSIKSISVLVVRVSKLQCQPTLHVYSPWHIRVIWTGGLGCIHAIVSSIHSHQDKIIRAHAWDSGFPLKGDIECLRIWLRVIAAAWLEYKLIVQSRQTAVTSKCLQSTSCWIINPDLNEQSS